MFDWPDFLSQHNIEYVTSGPNVSKGRIAIRCPLCGGADPSQHMTISLSGQGWRCWRNPDHRGIQPTRLIQVLLGCSFEQARTIVYGVNPTLPEDFLGRVNGALRPAAPPPQNQRLTLLNEFLPLKDLPSARPFIRYLASRGYHQRTILLLTEQYGLRYCRRGPFTYRIIFPVEFDRKLMTWTGRTISPTGIPRYKVLAVESDLANSLPAAVGPISHYLLWYDQLQTTDCDTIVLCEGPFDSLRINVLGAKYGIISTCFFTSRPGPYQIELLHALLPKFRRRFLMLDRDTTAMAYRVQGELSSLGIEILPVPDGKKDPGELTASDIRQLSP